MRPNLHHKFIALVLAGALVATGFGPRPARADSQDVGRVVVGLTALAILGKIIHDARKEERATVRPDPPRQGHGNGYGKGYGKGHGKGHGHAHGQGQGQGQGYYYPAPQPLPPQVSRYDLPADCLRDDPTRGGRAHMLGARCLSRNDVRIDRLPDACRVEAWDGHKVRRGYSAPCLRQRGYRLVQR